MEWLFQCIRKRILEEDGRILKEEERILEEPIFDKTNIPGRYFESEMFRFIKNKENIYIYTIDQAETLLFVLRWDDSDAGDSMVLIDTDIISENISEDDTDYTSPEEIAFINSFYRDEGDYALSEYGLSEDDTSPEEIAFINGFYRDEDDLSEEELFDELLDDECDEVLNLLHDKHLSEKELSEKLSKMDYVTDRECTDDELYDYKETDYYTNEGELLYKRVKIEAKQLTIGYIPENLINKREAIKIMAVKSLAPMFPEFTLTFK